jgi:hypothetical protein
MSVSGGGALDGIGFFPLTPTAEAADGDECSECSDCSAPHPMPPSGRIALAKRVLAEAARAFPAQQQDRDLLRLWRAQGEANLAAEAAAAAAAAADVGPQRQLSTPLEYGCESPTAARWAGSSSSSSAVGRPLAMQSVGSVSALKSYFSRSNSRAELTRSGSR